MFIVQYFMFENKDFDFFSKEFDKLSNGFEEFFDDEYLMDRQVVEFQCEDREGCNMEKVFYILYGFGNVF